MPEKIELIRKTIKKYSNGFYFKYPYYSDEDLDINKLVVGFSIDIWKSPDRSSVCYPYIRFFPIALSNLPGFKKNHKVIKSVKKYNKQDVPYELFWIHEALFDDPIGWSWIYFEKEDSGVIFEIVGYSDIMVDIETQKNISIKIKKEVSEMIIETFHFRI